MFRLILAAALTAAPAFAAPAFAAPAFASERAHTPQQVSDALKAGCSVQHVHTPAGKNGHQPAIVHCKSAASIETASRETAPRNRAKTGSN